ncbi:MAG: DNA repair protein RecO [Deltaproteobacteria bacterium]|nr:DNA repair protein RecO [Deltaproteobacteria bacterium]
MPSQGTRSFKSSRAFLVRSADRGEADLRLSFFTESDGLVPMMAKAALRSRKRFGGSLQKYFLLQTEWTEIPGRMAILNSCSLLSSYWEIVADWERVRHADYLLELAASIFPQPGPKPKAFRILHDEMRSLASGEPPSAAARKAEAAFLSLGGWGPDLGGCRRCGLPADSLERKDARSVRFILSEGRFICGNCASSGGLPMSLGAVRTWKALQSSSPSILRRLRIPNNILEELQAVIPGYLELHLGKSFRSLGGGKQ